MKKAIVTGASSGIGQAIALDLAGAGYSVVASGRDTERLDALAGTQAGIFPLAADLATEDGCRRLVEGAMAQLGSLDLLVNNAGIYRRGSAAETSEDDWQATLAINLDAPFRLSRDCLPFLLKTRGAIINIASDWGLQAGKRAAAYCASKGGLVLLTRAMAMDHAHQGVRINAVCPGDVDTPMLVEDGARDGMSHAAALAHCNAESPTGRVTQPEEVAALVRFLASEEARQVTGAAIPIDGGNTA